MGKSIAKQQQETYLHEMRFTNNKEEILTKIYKMLDD